MKGKTTLTLTDAATGKTVKRVEEHNMITNALRDIFRFPKAALVSGVGVKSALGQYMPFYKNLLSGVLLFESPVPENPDEYGLPVGYKIVGHAGDAYTGTSVTRGTLNQNETYVTDDGYHFTWDFATDKANGVISCVSLTHRFFGNIGVGTHSNDGVFFTNPNSMTVYDSYYCPVIVSDNAQFAGNFQHSIATFITFRNNEIYMRRVKIPDPDNIMISDTLSPYLAEEINIPSAVGEGTYVGYFFVNKTEKTLYFYKVGEVSQSTTEIKYFSIDPITLDVKRTGAFTFPRAITNFRSMAVYGGRIYLLADNILEVYTQAGDIIRQTNVNSGTTSYFFEHCKSIYNIEYYNNVYALRNCDADDTVIRNDPSSSYYSVDCHYPYSLNSTYNSNGSVAVTLNTSYLATINNLSEPIEKTDSCTLKVSYDIVN